MTSLTNIKGLGVDEIEKLNALRIRTTERLLQSAKDAKGRKVLGQQTGIPQTRLLQFANAADHLRIKGIGKDYVALLREVGVSTVMELRYRNPENLAEAMNETNKRRKLVKFLPSKKLVKRWIEQAKKLDPIITY